MNFFNRIYREKITIERMVAIYCNEQKHEKNGKLCAECSDILAYGLLRVERCKFGKKKPVCNKCTVHCYKENYKIKIKEIMCYSGPRMLQHSPLLAIMHLVDRKFYQPK